MLVTLGIQRVRRKPLMAQIAQGTFHLQTSEIQDLTCLFLAKDTILYAVDCFHIMYITFYRYMGWRLIAMFVTKITSVAFAICQHFAGRVITSMT